MYFVEWNKFEFSSRSSIKNKVTEEYSFYVFWNFWTQADCVYLWLFFLLEESSYPVSDFVYNITCIESFCYVPDIILGALPGLK